MSITNLTTSNQNTIQDIINTDCPYTQFPTAADTIDRKIDVSLDLLDDLKKYYNYVDTGNFAEIEKLLETNPRLSQCVVTSKDLNVLRDGMVAMQRWILNYIGEYLVQFSKPKGPWDKSTKYEKYNVVTFSIDQVVQTYIAFPKSQTSLDIPIGTLPTDANYWTCITLRGEKGESGTGMTPRGIHTLGVQYYKDDLVSSDNAFWYAAVDNLDQVPNQSSTSWKLMMRFSSDLLLFDNVHTSLKATTVQNALVELDHKIKCILNVTVPITEFKDNMYTYMNQAISANYTPDVRFADESITPALKARVRVHTYNGYMTFTVKKTPSVDLKIEVIILTSTAV